MEGNNFITSGDLAMWDTARTSRAGNYYGEGCGYGHRGHGAATTGVALGASALGVAVIGVIAVGWGINQASKARSHAADVAAAGNTKAIELVAATLAGERSSRENWQNMHAPTISQYVDVRTGAGAFSGAGSNAVANAEAIALNALLNGNGNGRSGQVCPQPVALYQPAMPCRCNTCGD